MDTLAQQYLRNTQKHMYTPIIWKSSLDLPHLKEEKKEIVCPVVESGTKKVEGQDTERDVTCTRCGQTKYWCGC